MDDLTAELRAITDEKYRQLCELLELSKEQTEVIKKEDIEGLERSIAQKQCIIEQIDRLDAHFQEYSAQLQLKPNGASLECVEQNDSVRQVPDLEIKIKAVLQTMLEVDQHNSELGEQLLAKLGEKLKHAVEAPVAVGKYQKVNSGATFINRQG